MGKTNLNRVVFYSKADIAGGMQLRCGESILRSPLKDVYDDINDILELYHINQYLDNGLFLMDWTQTEIESFTQKSKEFDKIIGHYMSTINDSNVINLYGNVLKGYIDSFWEIVNSQAIYKRISRVVFSEIISNDAHIIHNVLTKRKLVEHYNLELKNFLLQYPKSAELLISVYEVQDDFNKKNKFFPKSLTTQDKENILSSYLDYEEANLNYIGLIQNAKNTTDLRVSDKTRLKAKRLYKEQTQKFFSEKGGLKFGVSVSFPANAEKIKDGFINDLTANYSYSIDFIKKYSDHYSLFKNFEYLFDYIDEQKRIELVSKKSQIGVLERVIGLNSRNYYKDGQAFYLSEITSQCQIQGYKSIISQLDNSLEDILCTVYTSIFKDEYNYACNARFSFPSSTNSFFEKVRILAPEFESVLKQYKLFVEEGSIDFELLQISSTPSTIKDIPSLNNNKYIYLNNQNPEIIGCSNLLFSDQTLLGYVEPFRDKHYNNFFHLLSYEDVKYSDYEEYYIPNLNYLIERGLIKVDSKGFIQIANFERVLILKDLYENEVASYYHYEENFQVEANKMRTENVVLFEASLFSKPEQSYFNYFLNKSEFTNGLDMRNSYLHGTQANPDDKDKHEYAYLTYLKLVVLALLKIDDDLSIYKYLGGSKLP
jgi:hypothetical protein